MNNLQRRLKGKILKAEVVRFSMTKARKQRGTVVDPGGRVSVQLEWIDAPSFYLEHWLHMKDNYELDQFFAMYKLKSVESQDIVSV